MVDRFGRLMLWLGAVALLAVFPVAPVAAEESTVTGVVLESGFSGVVLQQPGKSAGVKYNTGRETRFTPADYSPVKGDTVKLTYYPKQLRNGAEILAVSTLTLVKMDPNRKELTSPADGTVVEVGRRNIRFHFPVSAQDLSMEPKRGMELAPSGWKPAVGDKVRVIFEKVRSRFGSGIVYVMSKIEKRN